MTPDLATLRDLQSRVRETEEPDREIDLALTNAFMPGRFPYRWATTPALDKDHKLLAVYDLPSDLDPRLAHEFAINDPKSAEKLPGFTSSIDATLSLVEFVLPGWQWMLRGKWAKLWQPSGKPPGNDFSAGGASPALALLAAMLSAFIVKAEHAQASPVSGAAAISQSEDRT